MVWNIKCQEKRLVTITPSDSWGGAGLLGVTIRLDDYGGADERLIRVLQVGKNSPAAIAGLVGHYDYLLGTTADSFDSTGTLARVLQQHVDKVVEVYVYNTESDVVRVVALMPTWSWGGNGLLGAEVGTGYLHRLPMSSRATIGSSVERKVRWVGMKPVHPAGQSTDTQQSDAQVTLEVEPQLEMEVVDDSEAPHDETHKTVQQVADHGHHVVPAQPTTVNHSAGQALPSRPIDHSNGDAQSVQAAEPSSQSENEQLDILPDTATAAASSSEPSGEAAEKSTQTQPSAPAPEIVPVSNAKVTQQEAEPSAQANTTSSMPPPPANAAALFAAPPPDASPTVPISYASQFMPPPPMSRFRQEKEGKVDSR